MNKTLIFPAVILVLLLNISAAYAASRTALVIGNSSYKSDPLKNPANDANDIAAILKTLGFDVVLRTNADKRSMVNGINLFAKKLSRSEIGIFYFAGHGIQIDNINYLIPVNSKVESESDVEFEGINAGRILGKMKEAGNRLNIVVLDACRNNPFARSFRSLVKGLAKMDAPPGSIIAYATSPGSLAEDGSGRNGVYTGRLLKNLKNPSLGVQEVFNQTGLDVMEQTSNKQVPWISSTPVPKFYLAGGTAPVKAKPYVEPEKKAVSPGSGSSGGTSGQSPGRTWREPVTGMEFVWVPAGCYQMGSNDGDSDEKPVHEVCLDGFWMAKYEVTQGQYEKIMGNNPSRFKSGDDYPVENVSWNDAKGFISELNAITGKKFSLPTEAQWEYAARSGGKKEIYAGGYVVDRLAWYNENSKHKTHLVGTKTPNGLGIYDMSGNVSEWCEDAFHPAAYTLVWDMNPTYNDDNEPKKVIRGGSWKDISYYLQTGTRTFENKDTTRAFIGFRCAMTYLGRSTGQEF